MLSEASEEVALAAGPPVGAAGGLKVGVRAVLGGGAVPGGDKLHPLGSTLVATTFAGLLAMLSLTAFEVLYAGRLTPG